MEILKAHPEVRRFSLQVLAQYRQIDNERALVKVTKLMGYEPLTKWLVLAVVLMQFLVAIYLRRTSPASPLFIFCAYALGGTANQNLFLAIHEITHNLAFKGVVANKLLAIFANLPIGIPYAAAFKVCLSVVRFFMF
jgi:sphingolipid delta-4 desaturase